MKASIVDLRYRMSNILKALDRNEVVTILYHGKEKGVIMPIRVAEEKSVEAHPFFGMKIRTTEPVSETMTRLRGMRC